MLSGREEIVYSRSAVSCKPLFAHLTWQTSVVKLPCQHAQGTARLASPHFGVQHSWEQNFQKPNRDAIQNRRTCVCKKSSLVMHKRSHMHELLKSF